EDLTFSDILEQLQITRFVLFLNQRDGTEGGGNFREAFFLGDLSKSRIDRRMFAILSGCSGLEVLCRGSDHSGRIARRDRDVTAFEEFEEPFRMFFFVVSG